MLTHRRTDDALRTARTMWINSIPTFGCLSGGPTPIMEKGRLHITETRAVLANNDLANWHQRGRENAIAVIRIELVVSPRQLSLPVTLLRLVPIEEALAQGDEVMGYLCDVLPECCPATPSYRPT